MFPILNLRTCEANDQNNKICTWREMTCVEAKLNRCDSHHVNYPDFLIVMVSTGVRGKVFDSFSQFTFTYKVL